MPYVLTDFSLIENLPLFGNGDCVALIKMMVPGSIDRPTSHWREVKKVIGSTGIARGTAIATFENRRCPRATTRRFSLSIPAHRYG